MNSTCEKHRLMSILSERPKNALPWANRFNSALGSARTAAAPSLNKPRAFKGDILPETVARFYFKKWIEAQKELSSAQEALGLKPVSYTHAQSSKAWERIRSAISKGTYPVDKADEKPLAEWLQKKFANYQAELLQSCSPYEECGISEPGIDTFKVKDGWDYPNPYDGDMSGHAFMDYSQFEARLVSQIGV